MRLTCEIIALFVHEKEDVINIALCPPQRWQDFEELTLEVARKIFDELGAHANGRQGQPQCGVDIFFEVNRERKTGVQCKRRDDRPDMPSTTLTFGEVKHEADNAVCFKPHLSFFIVATTGYRDVDLQKLVREENERRKLLGQFQIGLWFWEDYLGWINNDAMLMKWYQIQAQALYGEGVADRQILEVVRTAFDRRAFRTPLNQEMSEEFRQALSDTERALNTGLLLDRETRMPICRAPSGLAQLQSDPKRRVIKIIRAVRQAIENLETGIQSGTIQANGFYLSFSNGSQPHSIDLLRATAVRELNDLLIEHGMNTITDPMIV